MWGMDNPRITDEMVQAALEVLADHSEEFSSPSNAGIVREMLEAAFRVRSSADENPIVPD
jgi:hypothetical protein